jgi:hypothetical protein
MAGRSSEIRRSDPLPKEGGMDKDRGMAVTERKEKKIDVKKERK